MNELALFAGAGGGILAGRMLGWRTVCAVEFDEYARAVLLARQDDGSLEPFPVWDDVRTFDGLPWRGLVDVVSGGFPCQDISVAGKGDGLDGERSGLWREMARIIREVRPRFAYVENSPALTSRGLDVVLGDLASLGYDAEWGVLGASDVGAPHRRERIWVVAHTDPDGGRSVARHDGEAGPMADAGRDGWSEGSERLTIQSSEAGPRLQFPVESAGEALADADGAQREGRRISVGVYAKHAYPRVAGWWDTEPAVGRVAHGVASRVDRLRCIGNGQVPQAAAAAFIALARRGGWVE